VKLHLDARRAVLFSAIVAALSAAQAAQAQAGGQTPASRRQSDEPAKSALIEWNKDKAFAVADAEGNALGTLKDVVLEAASGQLAHAAVECASGGKPGVKAVEYAKLQWDAERCRFRSELTRAELDALPAIAQIWVAGRGKPVEAGHRRDAEEGGMHQPYLLASEVESIELSAKDGSLGTPRALILNTDPGLAAYLLLRHPEDKCSALRPVPWGAIRRLPGGKLGVDKTLAEMGTAPSISKEGTANLALPKFRLEIARFYGVPSPIDERAASVIGARRP
jgi:hypothetical protein